MKVFVAVCVIFFAVVVDALTEEQKERARLVSKECREKSGVSEDVVLKARQGQFADDEKLKEHLFCFAQKIGLVNEQGVVQPEVIKAKIAADVNPEVADKANAACSAVKAATPQQTVFDAFKCYSEQTEKRFSLS